MTEKVFCGAIDPAAFISAISRLRAARLTWWTEWPFENKSSWFRALRQLAGIRCVNSERSPAVQVLPHGAKVLIIRLGHLGDILHTAPFAQSVKRQRPDVRVEILVGPWAESLAKRFICFDAVHVHAPDFEQFHRGDRSRVLSSQRTKGFLAGLRDHGFDAVVSTSPTHLAEQVIMCAAGAKFAFGASGGLDGFPVAVEDRRRAFNSRMHEADWVSSFLADLGLNVDPASLSFPLVDSEVRRAEQLLISQSQTPVVIAPGAGWAGKCWPVERFAALADRLCEELAASIVLIGSADEEELCQSVVSGMRNKALNLAGVTSLGESAAVIAASRIFIGNDSAPLHLAAATGTPSVSIFGPTCASKWAPPGPQNRLLQAAGRCEGCIYWHCRAACIHDNRCMKSVAVDQVFAAASELLSECR